MTQPVPQRVALVTGAARRIGAEIARQLHQAGYRLMLHYRHSAEQAEVLASELNQMRAGSAVCAAADLNRHADLMELARHAEAHWGRLDLLVNNASSFYPTPLNEATEAQWDDLMASNLKAPFFLATRLAPTLAEHNGCIINIADIHGRKPMANHSIYSIAKAGNIMLTQSLALELAPKVRVNGIAPGAMLWPENTQGEEQINAEVLSQIPLGTLGGANAIAETVVFLAQQGGYITGQIVAVDGGRSLRQ